MASTAQAAIQQREVKARKVWSQVVEINRKVWPHEVEINRKVWSQGVEINRKVWSQGVEIEKVFKEINFKRIKPQVSLA